MLISSLDIHCHIVRQLDRQTDGVYKIFAQLSVKVDIADKIISDIYNDFISDVRINYL